MVEKKSQLPSKSQSREEKGYYDQDGFYILDEGGFYDPLGYYFDKDGYDAQGGRYNDAGEYVIAQRRVPDRLAKDGVSLQVPTPKADFEKLAGKFDADGFYILESGAYYDPFGFYFDSQGFDEAGGRYDDSGFYVSPFAELELDPEDDLDSQDDFDEPEDESADAALERQAAIEEHVVMAAAYARTQLQSKSYQIVKIEGIPYDTNIRSEQDVVKKVLEKRIPQFKYTKAVLVDRGKRRVSATAYVQSGDAASIVKMLYLHLQRCQLSVLKTWLVGFPDYLDQPVEGEAYRREMQLIAANFDKAKPKDSNPEEEEFIVQRPAKPLKKSQAQVDEENEFEISGPGKK